MSVTRILCEKCGHPQCWCSCEKPDATSGEGVTELRPQLGALGVAGDSKRRRARVGSPLLAASLAMLTCGGSMLAPSIYSFPPENDPTKSPEDRDRIAAAEAKRQRKADRKMRERGAASNGADQRDARTKNSDTQTE